MRRVEVGWRPRSGCSDFAAGKCGHRDHAWVDVGVQRWLWWQQPGLPVPWVTAMASIPETINVSFATSRLPIFLTVAEVAASLAGWFGGDILSLIPVAFSVV